MTNRQSNGVRQQMKRRLGSVLAAGVLLTGLAASDEAHAEKKPRLASLEDFGKCPNVWDGDTCVEALQTYVKAHSALAFDAVKWSRSSEMGRAGRRQGRSQSHPDRIQSIRVRTPSSAGGRVRRRAVGQAVLGYCSSADRFRRR